MTFTVAVNINGNVTVLRERSGNFSFPREYNGSSTVPRDPCSTVQSTGTALLPVNEEHITTGNVPNDRSGSGTVTTVRSGPTTVTR